MENTLNIYTNGDFPPHLYLKCEGVSVGSSPWESGGIPEGKAHKTTPPGISHSQANPHSASSNSPKLSVKCSYNFMAVAASSVGELMEAGILCIHLPLQISGTSIFWWVLGESFIFSFFSFYLGRIEVMGFKLFTCHSWNWNFSFYF